MNLVENGVRAEVQAFGPNLVHGQDICKSVRRLKRSMMMRRTWEGSFRHNARATIFADNHGDRNRTQQDKSRHVGVTLQSQSHRYGRPDHRRQETLEETVQKCQGICIAEVALRSLMMFVAIVWR